MITMIRYILTALFLFGILSCKSNGSMSSLTKENIRRVLKNPPAGQKLKKETIQGYVSAPAKDFFQKLFVGSKSTGENCEITVHANNAVSVSFLGDRTFDLVEIKPYPLFAAELENNQVLLVQHSLRRVVSVTQTIYDTNDRMVYQNSGRGDFIQSCIPL